MMAEELNPYAAPSTPTDQILEEPTDVMQVLPQQSVAIMLVLTCFTLGVYLSWWLYRRGLAVKKLAKRQAALLSISAGLAMCMGGFLTVGLVALILASGGNGLLPATAGILAVNWVFNIELSLILYADLKHLFVHQAPSAKRFSVVGTLLLGAIYLQWKINRIHALQQWLHERHTEAERNKSDARALLLNVRDTLSREA